jgi:hypothetical protein
VFDGRAAEGAERLWSGLPKADKEDAESSEMNLNRKWQRRDT